MSIVHNAALAAATAFACLSVAVSAQDRTPVTAHVLYADLNLATTAGRAALAARVRRAGAVACPNAGTLAEKADAARCRREMAADGAVQLARLQGRSEQRLALAGH